MTGFAYIVSLDVGSERDPAAISVLQRREVLAPGQAPPRRGEVRPEMVIPSYDLRYLDRAELKTPYQELFRRVETLLLLPDLRGNSHFVLDATGAGMPVVQIMQDLAPIPIVITAGHSSNPRSEGGHSVPKRDLITSLQSVLQSRRLRIAKGVKHLEQLQKEIVGFKMKQSSTGYQSFESATESIHDDLVMSLAIGVWYMEYLYGYRSSVEDLVKADHYDPFEAYA